MRDQIRTTDQIRLKFYTNIVHPFITIFVPFWFMMTTVLVLLNSAFYSSGTIVFPPMYFALLLLVGVSETVTGNLLYKEKIGSFLPRLREFVFVVIFGLFFVLLFHGNITQRNFNLAKLKIWLPTLLLAAEWLMSYYIHQKLRERELFLKFFEGKEEKDVRQLYDAYMHEGGESMKAAKSVRKFIIAFMAITFVFYIIMTWGAGISYPGLSIFMILSYFVVNFLIVIMLNTWHETQFIMMDGYLVSRKQKRFRIGIIVLLFIVIFVVVIPASGSKSLLPASYLQAFYEWLQTIGKFEPVERKVREVEFNVGESMEGVSEQMGSALGGMAEEQNLAKIARIIGFIILGVLGLGAVLFLLLPLFRGMKAGVNPLDVIRKGVRSAIKAIADAVAAFVRAIEAWRKKRRVRVWKRIGSRGKGGIVQEALERAAGRLGLSRKERRAHGRMLKSFFRFTRWGEKRGIPFRTTIGPWEYALMLTTVVPEVTDDCVEIADIFEEVLFSTHAVDDNRQSVFFNKIKQIVKNK